MKDHTRRQFAAAAAAMIVPSHVLGGPDRRAPSDRLVIAAVGVGGVGASYLQGVKSENIAVLCDVDDRKAAKTFETYPKAKRYRDFRRMLETEKGIDAVVIATPDHSHAVIAAAAMQLGKHVYCAKPLTRTIAESRALLRISRENKVATQMSVQSCMSDPSCTTVEWVRSGAIGNVREVHVWTDRPVWPQGLLRPADTPPVPETLDWDVWLGPAPYRPYNRAYHPFSFRGWYDFGTGALGDMGCHTFHVIVGALELGPPTAVTASVPEVRALLGPGDPEHWSGSKRVDFPETFPQASIVSWHFPARKALPAVRLTWYDGGLRPPRPPEMDLDRELPTSGILFIGEKGTILSGFTGGPRLLPESRNASFTAPPKTLERSKGHYQEWVASCKGGKPANCEFGFGTRLTELVLLGNLAVRTRKTLRWDPAEGRTSDAEANKYVEEPYRSGWTL